MVSRASRRAIVALLLAGAAGCGTTVPLRSGTSVDGLTAAPSGSSDDSGTPQGQAGTNGGSGGSSGQGTTGVQGGSVSSAPNSISTTPTAAVAGSDSAGAAARPHSAVQVGIGYSSDGAKFGSTFGGNLNTGDEKRAAQTVVDWMNAHGGLAGHRVAPVFFDFQLTSASSWAQTEQQMCTAWTQDAHVVAALWVGVNAPTNIVECLQSRGVPFLENGYVLHDQQDFKHWSLMSDAAELEGDAAARTYVEGLAGLGFFTPKDKIGVVGEDYHTAQRVYANALRPQLSRHRLSVAVYEEIHTPQSTPDIGSSVSAIQSAVLKMRSEGVTKVLFLCYGCAGFFMQSAQSQGWNPTYGLSTLDALWNLGGSAPAGQLNNAKAVGWVPLSDVPENVAPQPNATARLCAGILKGQIPSQEPRFFAFNFCDALLTLHTAARPLTTLSAKTLNAGIGALGEHFQSALVLHTDLGPSKHWGVDQARNLAFDSACSCFRYTGNAYPIVR
ncbi:MAG: hypothetical protein QOE58_1094 [Actinomycetota bacterium]|nr:hypothetical protein [Actinomycetota bacterium]